MYIVPDNIQFKSFLKEVIPMPKIKDKHLKLDQEKIDKVRKILGAKTDTDAVDKALSQVIADTEIDMVLKKLAGQLKIEKIYD